APLFALSRRYSMCLFTSFATAIESSAGTSWSTRFGRAASSRRRRSAPASARHGARSATAATTRASFARCTSADFVSSAMSTNPGEPWAYKEIGLSTLYLGKPEQALEWFAKADRIGPRDPGRWTWLDGRGHALILLGRDEE